MSLRFELEHLGAITARGEGALNFAGAQFTANHSLPADNLWRATAWCDPKGRTICVMMASARKGAVDLVLPKAQTEMVSKRLSMFAIGHEVRFSTHSRVLGCFVKTASDACLAHDSSRAVFLSDEAGATSDPSALRRWQLADLRAGFPWLGPETSTRHLPQFLGLEAFSAISYDKGCYPGQEVIARLHYLGKIKHGLYGLSFAGTRSLEPGSKVFDVSGKPAGEILYGIPVNHHFAALAVLADGFEPGQEVTTEADGEHWTGKVTRPEALC